MGEQKGWNVVARQGTEKPLSVPRIAPRPKTEEEIEAEQVAASVAKEKKEGMKYVDAPGNFHKIDEATGAFARSTVKLSISKRIQQARTAKKINDKTLTQSQ